VRHFSRLINYEPEGDDEPIDLEEDFGSNNLTRTSSGIRRLLHGQRINELEEEGNTDDPLYRISYATALEEVFEVLREVGPENVTAEQVSQAVVTIRDLQRVYMNTDDMPTGTYDDCSHFLAIKFNSGLRESPEFATLLNQLHERLGDISSDSKALLLQSLRRLDCELSEPLMVGLTIDLTRAKGTLSLRALSYFSMGITKGYYDASNIRNIWLRNALVLAPHIPTIIEGVKTMETPNEVKWVAIAMKGVCRIVSDETNQAFCSRVCQLIDDGVFDNSSEKRKYVALIKVLHFYLIYPDYWSYSHNHIKKVIYQLEDCLDILRPIHLKILARAVNLVGGPIRISSKVDAKIQEMLSLRRDVPSNLRVDAMDLSIIHIDGSIDDDDVDHVEKICDPIRQSTIPVLEFLSLTNEMKSLRISNHHGVVDNTKFIDHIEAGIKSPFFSSYSSSTNSIYKLLRSTPLGLDQRLVSMFFNRQFDEVSGDWIELTRVINKYINFFTSGSAAFFGKARCTEFEQKVLKAVLGSIESSQRQLVFATQVQFLLMFGGVERLSEVIMGKVQAMVRDADILALYTFGRIFEDINMKTYNLPKEQVSLINGWIQERTAQVYRQLTHKDEKLSVKTRMMLLQNHLRRKFHVDQEEINFMVKEFGDILDHTDLPFPVMVELTKILRKADFIASFKAPHETDITEKLMDQVLKYRDEVHFHVVYHILVLLQFQCVSLQTAKHLDFLQLSLELFNRDCLECTDNVIMAMRALSTFCYFKCLNKESVDKIFNLDYLDVFERTLERVKPKLRRPLRTELMRLNRTVAILYPQFGVPWFHEKFCKEQVDRSNLNSYHRGSSLFEADVYSTLLSVVGGNKFIKEGSLSKYYHQVDFELWKYRDPIGDTEFYPLTEVLGIQSNQGNVYDPSKYERIGIILYQVARIGIILHQAEMTARELEALGYRAVVISDSHWNSMALATPQDKTSYISNVLGLLRETRKEASNGS